MANPTRPILEEIRSISPYNAGPACGRSREAVGSSCSRQRPARTGCRFCKQASSTSRVFSVEAGSHCSLFSEVGVPRVGLRQGGFCRLEQAEAWLGIIRGRQCHRLRQDDPPEPSTRPATPYGKPAGVTSAVAPRIASPGPVIRLPAGTAKNDAFLDVLTRERQKMRCLNNSRSCEYGLTW